MSNIKSSVENFWKQLEEKGFQETEGVNRINISIDVNDYMELKKQAKAMHKEEVVDFAFNFYYDFSNLIGVPFNLVSENKMNAEFYYDKVFGGNNE